MVLISGCTAGPNEKDTNAEQSAKEVTPENSGVDKKIVDFLSSVNEMRKMNITRGELAQRKGGSETIREYGALLVEDQTKMLKDINAIIEIKKIVLPKFIDLTFNEELGALRSKEGKAFDLFFVNQMIFHHHNEAQAFREAMAFEDIEVKTFAIKYLPVIEQSQSHLQKITAGL
jgi:putative membrane protein